MPNDTPTPPANIRRPNSFQLLGSILAACAGIRANSARGRGFADASLGSIFGALLIFAAFAAAGCYGFIHAIRSAVAQ